MNKKQSKILLSIGSNLGNRIENIKKSIEQLSIVCAIEEKNISDYYESEPFGNPNQNWFINIALLAETDVTVFNLLYLCKSIEFALGREKAAKWTERIIDIDILLYDDLVVDLPNLTIPHKYMCERKFVLEPCSEIAGDLVHPIANKQISELNAICTDLCIVRKVGTI